jgi:hypothetical protein
LSLTSVFAQKQYEIEGVIVPKFIDFKGHQLELNGFGTRSKMWVEVYVQALFVSKLSEDPNEIIEGKSDMAIRIQIISSLVTSKKLSKAFDKGLIKSVGEENISKIKTQSDMLNALISREDTKEGDFFNLIYSALEDSILVFKNDKLEGKIPGFDFKKALFGIWLSDNPVDKDLKNALLGKS